MQELKTGLLILVNALEPGRFSVGDHRPVGRDRDPVATQKFSTRSFSFGRDRTRVAIQEKKSGPVFGRD